MHLIIYLFKKFLLAQQKYNIYSKKLLAILILLEIWKVYIEKTPKLNIYINYKNLSHFII